MIEQLSADGTKQVAIHWERNGRIACMPHATDLQRLPQHTVMRSNDVRAVTCAACKRTPGFGGGL